MKILINYADEKFRKAQKRNSKSALKKGGFDRVIEYTPDNLGDSFYNKHKSFLIENKRGNGYWIWKPYIIRKTLSEINDGDFLFYCDAGALFVNSVDYLVEALNSQNEDILVGDLPLIERQWTKRECFERLECNDKKYKDSNQACASFILIRKTEDTIAFFNEYYEACENYSILNDDKILDQDEYFIDHRHDQSILSLLLKKRNYRFFRDISQYGIRPFQYITPKRLYCLKSHTNSNFPQIVLHYRKDNWIKLYAKEALKDKLGFKLRLVKDE